MWEEGEGHQVPPAVGRKPSVAPRGTTNPIQATSKHWVTLL